MTWVHVVERQAGQTLPASSVEVLCSLHNYYSARSPKGKKAFDYPILIDVMVRGQRDDILEEMI